MKRVRLVEYPWVRSSPEVYFTVERLVEDAVWTSTRANEMDQLRVDFPLGGRARR